MTSEEASGITSNPHAQARRAGDRLAGSYVNFFITSTSLVYPHLDPRYDDEVGDLLADEFPGRRIDAVAGREILLGGGNIHCITQQVPRPQEIKADRS